MSYTALYRKFRPEVFEDVKGQDAIVTTLKNQIRLDRMGHAYLFCGTRGTGKTTIAKIFARAVNCESPIDGSPCGKCSTCRNILAGANMNVQEIDAASNNGVDNIREIVEDVEYSPAQGKYKVYIIDEVHMLSIGAFNALLKTLEEPPSYCIFILATTEVHKIPITILSRCQRYDFKRISLATIAERMKDLMTVEGITVEDRALRYIAKMADGSMRDGLSLLDQCLAFHYGEALTYENALNVLGAVDTEVFHSLLSKILVGDVAGCIETVDEVIMQGRELPQFVTDFIWYMRNLLLAKSSDNIEDVVDMSKDNLERLKEVANEIDAVQIIRYIRVFSELSDRIRSSTQKRVVLEVALIKLCKPETEVSQEALIERIRKMEAIIKEGKLVAAPVVAAKDASTMSVQTKRPEMPKALPQDLERIRDKWSQVIGTSIPPMKLYLKEGRPSIGEDGGFSLVFEDGMAYDYFMIEEHRVELEQVLSEMADKEVSVQVRSVRNVQEYQEKYIELSEIITMPIEEE